VVKWDSKLDTIQLSKAWRAYDDDLPPPGPMPVTKAPSTPLHFWLGDDSDRQFQRDAAPS
jgi:hypothetical protein